MKVHVDRKENSCKTGVPIKHVFVEAKIQKKNRSGTVLPYQLPRTRTLARMAPIVEFKRELIPMRASST